MPSTGPPRTGTSSALRWVSLASVCLAAGIVWLAFADLAVAVPQIAGDFTSTLSTLQWANNAFSLVTGALVIAAGKFGDLFGRRLMLQLGTVLVAVFSLLAALAPSVEWLILGRGLMGVGAALILPASLALIPPEFTGRAEITAFGIWQAVAWAGLAAGPAIGGVLADGLGWRWLFWINLPLAALALVGVRATTPESRDPRASRHIDWLGLSAIGLAAFALLYALTDGPIAGWGSPLILALFVATAVLAAGWYQIERRIRDPLVDLRLFAHRSYNGALTANLTMNLAFAGLSFLLVLWLQDSRGYSAVQSGMLMLPATVGVFIGIPLGARADARRGGRRPVLVGLAVAGVGLCGLGFLGAGSTLWLLAVPLAVVGFGLGMVSAPVANTAVGEVPIDLAGDAAGVFKMSSMLGGALGVALLSALAQQLRAQRAAGAVQATGLGPEQVSQVEHALVNSPPFQQAIASLPPAAQRTVIQAVDAAFTSSVATTLLATGILTLVAVVAVALLWPPRRRAGASGQR